MLVEIGCKIAGRGLTVSVTCSVPAQPSFPGSLSFLPPLQSISVSCGGWDGLGEYGEAESSPGILWTVEPPEPEPESATTNNNNLRIAGTTSGYTNQLTENRKILTE